MNMQFTDVRRKIAATVMLACAVIATSSVQAYEAPAANPGDYPKEKGPCGNLNRLGDQTFIYNKSRYPWDVVFVTQLYFVPFVQTVRPGVVKYLTNGVWKDVGYETSTIGKTYRIPVGAGKTVPIAYCADKSHRRAIIVGTVEFVPGQPDYNGPRPDNGMEFYGNNGTPRFRVHHVTPYVDFNRNSATAVENGSITICPNDPQCNAP